MLFYNDQGTVEIKGIVATDPEIRATTTHLHLLAREIKLDEEWHEISGNALLFVPRYPTYDYGDVLLVIGELETPAQFDDFDYKGYLAHQGIYSTMVYPKIEVTEKGEGFKPLAWVYSSRNHLAQNLATILPEPQASLAQGIILGIRGTIPASIKANFAQTGTAHLLAISGLHLSIMAGILLSLGIWLFGKRHYIYVWLALIMIWLYALLTGMHPPIIRAAIMASLFLTAELLGRQRSAITSLAFAAAVMIGISPQILWDAAFQLSFLAMAGLIFIAPPLMALGRRAVNATVGEGRATPLANIVTDSFSITLGAIIATWPVIAYYFGIISFVGPLATFLALPALPGIIITGALAGGLGFITSPVAQVVGWIAWLFLSYLLVVGNGLATIPISHIEVGSIPVTLIWIYYSALGTITWLSSRKKLTYLMPKAADQLRSGATSPFNLVSRLPKKWAIPPLVVAAVLVSLTAPATPDNNLHVSFLDIGQGDAILIQTPAHQDILIDGGPDPQAISLGLSDKMPLWDRTIELVILTHPSADHVTGLVEVLNRYKVKQVLYPDLEFKSDIYNEWLRLVSEKNIKYTIAQAGQQINLGEGVAIEVLNPQTPPLTNTYSDVDNNGAVLRASIGEVSFLLTADIMQEAELELITRRANLSSTVLKVAHHGSDTSSCQEFLAVVNPRLAVISVGADNKFGHPCPEVMERLKEKVNPGNIYRTDKHGTVEFITDGERLWVKPES